MSTQESESALDAIVLEAQQTWKRARTTREIGQFLTRRFAALEESTTVDDQSFDDIEELAA